MMRRNRRSILVLLAGVAAAGPVSLAAAQTSLRVLTDDLGLRRAELVEIDESSVLLREADGRSTRVGLETVLAISVAGVPDRLPEPPPAVLANAAVGAERFFVELTDAQRIVLDILPGEDAEVLTGAAFGLGQARIPLDRVARIARAGAPWRVPVPTEDLVLLLNGDRLSGFVVGVGGEVEVETAPGVVSTVPLDRVGEIRLANPAAAAATRTLLVTDDMGVTLAASALTAVGSGEFRLTTTPAALGLDSRGEETIAYDRPHARLLGLRATAAGTGSVSAASAGSVLAMASLAPQSVTPTGDRRWTPRPVAEADESPVLALGDVVMPAPAEAVYPLGSGVRASRMACVVRASAPGAWTDCVARVEAVLADDRRVVLGEHRVTSESTDAEINAQLPAGTRAIVLLVDPGRYGAVQDGVVFESPRVLLAE